MKIAHLILCHTDPAMLKRTATRLSAFSDVYIHVDSKTDISDYLMPDSKNIYFTSKRYNVGWGTWSSVEAEIELLREALSSDKKYDRFVLLQGLDYPIKTDSEIMYFYKSHPTTEFNRALPVLHSSLQKIRAKATVIHFSKYRCLFTKAINVLMRKLKLQLRSGRIIADGINVEPYWGTAQWAYTRPCAEYIVNFFDTHPAFNRWFYLASTVDELYFSTVVYNSDFVKNTFHEDFDTARSGDLDRFKNLTHFIYDPGHIRIFTVDAAAELQNSKYLYARKLTSSASSDLMDLLDQVNSNSCL